MFIISLAQLFFECETFQLKHVEEIKIHILCSITTISLYSAPVW
jgi:hypothetical protein